MMARPLAGKRILVTRPAAQAAALAARIAACGGETACFPLIDIAPPEDWQAVDEAASRLEAFALVVFVSQNAVSHGLTRLLAHRPWPRDLAAVAPGPGTAEMLAHAGIPKVIAPPCAPYDSESLLALDPLRAERMAGRVVLILRGNGGRELLAETLRVRGARVECVPCYRRMLPTDGTRLMSLLRNNALDAVSFSSSEGLRNLMQLLDTDSYGKLAELPAFVPHRRIADEAARLGLHHVVLTESTDSGLVAGLCVHRWSNHE
ncbi:MAG: uroporphyrinogen-III synthase [Candidatus Accumulibacter sp.]|jgi:uroporphyrinogen-III synthase|nr:uroporphyrinogen-III synthase [Accumulibacter sp.]